jgi:hypothetical protein
MVSFRGDQYTIDWGHLLVVLSIAIATIWYLFDTRQASTNINNILLIQPLVVVSLLFCAFILPQCFEKKGKVVEVGPRSPTENMLQAPALPTDRNEVFKMLALGGLLGALAFSMMIIGFDVGIFLFTFVAMIICGERRLWMLTVFSLVLTLVVVIGFRAMMPYPMPTMFL